MCMTIDLEADELIPIGDLTKKRLGKRVSPATIWRWRLKGVKAGGITVKLEAVRVAGVWHTTAAAFATATGNPHRPMGSRSGTSSPI